MFKARKLLSMYAVQLLSCTRCARGKFNRESATCRRVRGPKCPLEARKLTLAVEHVFMTEGCNRSAFICGMQVVGEGEEGNGLAAVSVVVRARVTHPPIQVCLPYVTQVRYLTLEPGFFYNVSSCQPCRCCPIVVFLYEAVKAKLPE